MIISASRRTDLPACHAEWLCRRFSEGYALVRNPFRFHQVQRVRLSPETVEGIVFWTKDPLPLAPRLTLFRDFPWYFQWTLTPYGRDIEPGLPDKKRLLAAFRALAEAHGPLRFVWRYDPVLLSPRYTEAFHRESFRAFCEALSGCADTCVVSFLDHYGPASKRLAPLRARAPSPEEAARLTAYFLETAARFGIALRACCETGSGLPPAACVDAVRLSAIGGLPLDAKKDRSQRPDCACAASVDIGAYDTCRAGCLYCYAMRGAPRHTDPASPLLTGPLLPEDIIAERAMPSLRLSGEPSLFS